MIAWPGPELDCASPGGAQSGRGLARPGEPVFPYASSREGPGLPTGDRRDPGDNQPRGSDIHQYASLWYA